jgi:hypothetical protein
MTLIEKTNYVILNVPRTNLNTEMGNFFSCRNLIKKFAIVPAAKHVLFPFLFPVSSMFGEIFEFCKKNQ